MTKKDQRRQEMANRLGVSVEELKAARSQGTGLRKFIKERGIELSAEDKAWFKEHRARKRAKREKTAKRLGMSIDELKKEMKAGKTRKQMAEERGVDLKKRGKGRKSANPDQKRIEKAARKLGMTVEEVEAELANGKTIRQLRKAHRAG